MSGQTQHLWVYLVATTLGAVLAVPLFFATRPSSSN
jgi:glycerol uptake facilitator-like aquaporin